MHADTYHAQRGLYLSSHMLMAMHQGASVEDVFKATDRDTDAYHFGRAAHSRILEPDQFHAQYRIGGPVNERTGKTYGRSSKTYRDWVDEQTCETLRPEDAAKLELMHQAVHDNPAAASLLASGEAEKVYREEYGGIPCQCRCDWIGQPERLVDLKTCSDIFLFENDALRFGYHWQMAFYRELIGDMPVYLIAVEKTAKPTCIVIQVSSVLLDQAADENEYKMAEVKDEFMYYRETLLKERDELCHSELS